MSQTLLLHCLFGSRLGEVLLLFLLLGVAFVSNAPPTSSLWVAPRRGAPTIPFAWGAFAANAPTTSPLWVAPRRGAPTIPFAWGAFDANAPTMSFLGSLRSRFTSFWGFLVRFSYSKGRFLFGGGIAAEKYLYLRRCGREPPTHYIYSQRLTTKNNNRDEDKETV